jgi:hypothetical protein
MYAFTLAVVVFHFLLFFPMQAPGKVATQMDVAATAVAAAPLLSKEEIAALPGAYVVSSDAFVAPSNARVCQPP